MARYKGENRAWEGAARLLANPARGHEGVRDPLSTWPRLAGGACAKSRSGARTGRSPR